MTLRCLLPCLLRLIFPGLLLAALPACRSTAPAAAAPAPLPTVAKVDLARYAGS